MAYYSAVRYGYDKLVGGFLSYLEPLRRNTKVILHTDRGVEIGTLLRVFDGDIPTSLKVPLVGEILRVATDRDREQARLIAEKKQMEEYKFAYNLIERYKLKMKLVRVEHLFGGDKIIFFFLADSRVDFRQLVKDLAREYRTRIEMRQIGVRDEAKMLGSCEMCGEKLCCTGHIRRLEPVSMSMAKNQLKTLDPTRISGRCGRLRCCLAYENETYTRLKKELPKIGVHLETSSGQAKVIGQLPLKGEVLVVNEHRVRRIITKEELQQIIKGKVIPLGAETRVVHTGDTQVLAHLSDETEIRKQNREKGSQGATVEGKSKQRGRGGDSRRRKPDRNRNGHKSKSVVARDAENKVSATTSEDSKKEGAGNSETRKKRSGNRRRRGRGGRRPQGGSAGSSGDGNTKNPKS